MSASTLISTDAADLLSTIRQSISRSAGARSGSAAVYFAGAEGQRAGEFALAHSEQASSAMQQASSEIEGMILAACEKIQAEAAAFGSLPPVPPTLRAKIGLPLVRLVNRLVWWQTAVSQRFANALYEFARIQSEQHASQNRASACLQDRLCAVDLKLEEVASGNSRISRKFLALENEYRSLEQNHNELQRTVLDVATIDRDRERDEKYLQLERNYAGLADKFDELTRIIQSAAEAKNEPLRQELATHINRVTALEQQAQFSSNRIAGVESAMQFSQHRLIATETAWQAGSADIQKLWAGLAAEMAAREATEHRVAGISSGIESAAESVRMDDGLYVLFEDRFRGSRNEIKERQRLYVPILREAGAGGAEMPVVDLGCGRGEWLELLKSEGMSGHGVDSNRTMLEICSSIGLHTTQGDALSYLANLPAGTMGAVTSFHMIEHLPFGRLLGLIDNALRVLKPGGLLILETPNPANILVSTHTFHLDPTHMKPIPSELLWFLMEVRGFRNLRHLELHPPEFVELGEGAPAILQRFRAPLDYSIIGERP